MSGARTGRIETDLSRWPLMVVTFPRAPVEDDELHEFIEGQRRVIRRGEKFAAIANASGASTMRWSQRRILVDWLVEAEATARDVTVAIAIVADNPLMRGGIAAVLWAKSPPCPTKVVPSTAEGLDFCLEGLERAGIEGLEPARRLRSELVPREP